MSAAAALGFSSFLLLELKATALMSSRMRQLHKLKDDDARLNAGRVSADSLDRHYSHAGCTPNSLSTAFDLMPSRPSRAFSSAVDAAAC